MKYPILLILLTGLSASQMMMAEEVTRQTKSRYQLTFRQSTVPTATSEKKMPVTECSSSVVVTLGMPFGLFSGGEVELENGETIEIGYKLTGTLKPLNEKKHQLVFDWRLSELQEQENLPPQIFTQAIQTSVKIGTGQPVKLDGLKNDQRQALQLEVILEEIEPELVIP